MRALKNAGKKLLQKGFEAGQVIGCNILPNHFYSSTPDMVSLRRRQDWRAPLEMIGVRGRDISTQVAFLEETCAGVDLPDDVIEQAWRDNGEQGYGAVEADFLYAFVVHHKPARIMQVGSGVSTAVILRAATAAKYEPDVVCVDPYPTSYLDALARRDAIKLRNEPAQVTPLDEFARLQAGDLLFVDSTHAVKVGSEVNRIILDILPRLAPGVWVHFHDIYFPYDYQRTVFSELFFSVESTLLQAFLINNSAFRIAVSFSMLHYAAPDKVARVVRRYSPQTNEDGLRGREGTHFPCATWLHAT